MKCRASDSEMQHEEYINFLRFDVLLQKKPGLFADGFGSFSCLTGEIYKISMYSINNFDDKIIYYRLC